MSQKKRYVIINDRVRDNAIQEIIKAPIGSSVSVGPGERSLDQNAKLHAIFSDIANSGMMWAGKKRNAAEWKVLLVSAHTKATQGEVDFVIGIEGEFVNVRESTSRMSVARAASLITYAIAFCDTNGIHLTETIRGGFHDGSNDWRAA